ncbi:MAG: class E sortase [Cellulomonadaceae bacterium]|nr:class E sortase [Cellulomonadaceae bacterium]
MRRHTVPSAAPVPRASAVVLEVVGELLLTLGVLLGLFVVWQLWWTDVVGTRAQAAVVAGLDWEPPAPVAADPVEVERRDAAPAMVEPALATTFATLQVPRWGATDVRPISQGTTTRDVLDPLGIGHYDGTAMPGGLGNFAVAGHRTTYGKPLNRIAELQVGDALVVRTEQAWFVYRVTTWSIVSPRDVDVIAPVPGQPDAQPTEAQMTLTTCHPMFSARERYVVHALLDYWMPTADGTPVELGADVSTASAQGGA